jgi:hypothetical protein
MRPNFLETPELDESLFSTDREKKVFHLIAKEWEDHRPEQIDCRILAEHLGGDGVGLYVSSLIEGLQKLSPEMFLGRIIELRESIIVRRLAGRLQKELAVKLKTGCPLDLTEILQDVDELRLLHQPKEVNIIGLEKIMPKSIFWLWPGRIPKSMLTLCCGDPGVGKSFCSIALAARLSRGIALPDSQISTGCGSLFILGEDPIAEAVRPRADANGADCSKIFIFQEPGFHLTDVAKIRWIIERNKDIGLIVIDPLTAFFPAKTKYFEDPSVRAALLPLAGFAEESGVAVLAIAHFRKAEAEAAIHRVAGSVGLAGIARSILAVTRDEDDDPDRRLLMSLKANYSKRPSSLAFRIGQDLKILFEDAPIEADAENVLSSHERKEEAAETSYAREWLEDTLQGGPLEVGEIGERAKKAGISRSALYRAKKKIKVLHHVQGVGQFHTSTWELPQHAH